MKLSMIGGLITTVLVFLFPEVMIGIFSPDPRVIAEGVGYVRVVAFSYMFFCLSQILVSSMRSVESVKIGVAVSLSSLVLNIVFNYIFIFGIPQIGLARMDARGAALATVIARVAECAIIVAYMFVSDKKLTMRLKDFFARDKQLFWDFVRYGLPVLGGNVVWAVNVLTQSGIIGRMGAEAVASVSITGMLNNLVFVWIMGLGAGVGIMTGKTVVAGKYELMKLYSKTIQIIFVVLGFVCGGVIFILKDYFLMLYTIEEATRVVAIQFMTVLSISSIGRAYQATCLAGLVKAGGDTGFVFKNDTIFVFLVVLPSALIAMYGFKAPPWVIYACLQSDQILKCFVAVVKINRFKWMKNLTRDGGARIV
ncbi:MATE family efflux transporter [Clostridia bacterium]|nr:MATE family efflux transporter [Clostridia bacterium]